MMTKKASEDAAYYDRLVKRARNQLKNENIRNNRQREMQSKLKNQRWLRGLFIGCSTSTKKSFYFGQKSAIIRDEVEENSKITR